MNHIKPIPQLLIDAIDNIKQSIKKSPLKRICPSELLTLQAFIGKNRLYEAFKTIEHKTIVRYQVERRMEEACKLLEEGRLSKKKIALKCGHTKATNFTRDFKKILNRTPNEWLDQDIQVEWRQRRGESNCGEKLIRKQAKSDYRSGVTCLTNQITNTIVL